MCNLKGDSMRFTDKYISNLKPESKMYQKREGEGFGVRVLPSGLRIFIFVYTIAGKRRQMNLGDYPDVSLAKAKDRATEARMALKDGKDPQEVGFEWHSNPERAKREAAKKIEDELNNPTVSKLITEYIEKHAMPYKRGWAEDKRILVKDALPAWGKRLACDITKRDVVLLLEAIVKRGAPGSANNNFKIIRKMFGFAVERDILQHSPCDGVKMPAPLVRKDRYLNEDEITTFWDNLETCHVSDEVRRALRLILVTGQRPGEVIGMHTSEIDGNWWTIPAERSKNKRSHHVFLTKTAIDLVGPLKVLNEETNELTPKGYIFPCPHIGKEKPIENTVPAQVVRRNIAAHVLKNGKPVLDSGGNPVTENLLGVSDFTPHDLRRTAATFISKLGFMDEIIDAVLNHTKQGIIRTYNVNRYDKEIQKALESWERKLNSILTKKESNVIPITAGQKAA
jgi:integrase